MGGVPVVYAEIASQLANVPSIAGWERASGHLREAFDTTSRTDPLLALIEAFDYHFPVEDGPEVPFSAQLSTKDGRYPPFLPDISDDRLAVWEVLYNSLDHDLVKARIGDLLWLRGCGAKFPFGLGAAAGYIAIAKSPAGSNDRRTTEALRRNDCATRALDLAVQLNNTGLIQEAIEFLSEAVVAELQRAPARPALIVDPLQRLARLGTKIRPDLNPLLLEARSKFDRQPFMVEGVIQIQIALAPDPEEKRSLQEELVAQWVNEAGTTTGLLALSHLERARELAAAFGLAETLEAIRRELGPVGVAAEADYADVEVEVNIPKAKIESLVAAFFAGEEGFLRRFGSYIPVSGDPNDAEQGAREMLAQSAILSLVTTIVSNADGRTVRTLKTDEDRLQYAITQESVRAVQFWSAIAVLVLSKARDTARPSRDECLAQFTTSFISPEVAERFAAAFEYYWDGEFDEAVCIAVPRIEAVVRQMAKAVGVLIFNEESGRDPGMYRALGMLLSELRGRLPDDVHAYLTCALADPLGVNLRNRLCHGLLTPANQQDATLALHLAAVLATLGPSANQPWTRSS